MKSLPLLFLSLVGACALLVLPAGEALAQAKGAAKATTGGAKAATGGAKATTGGVKATTGGAKAVTGGAKAGGTVAGAKAAKAGGTVIGAKSGGIVNKGVNSYGTRQPIAGLGTNNGIILGGGLGGIGLGGVVLGGAPLTSGFSPYLSGYPFQSGLAPLDYAYTPYAGPALVDPNLNNVRGYPPSTMYPNSTPNLFPNAANPKLYPGGVQLPPELGPSPKVANATVEVTVPVPDAEIWFNGVKTTSQGLKREFLTPELAPGQTYSYELRVKWKLNGKDYDQTRTVTLHSGSQIVVTVTMENRDQVALPPGIKI